MKNCVFVTMIGVALAACSVQTKTEPKPKLDTLVKQLPIEIEYRNTAERDTLTVLLLGENHASVVAQNNLATTLEALHKRNALDAVLIEGTNGELDVASFRASFNQSAKLSSDELWRRELSWGRLAGYEYFALKYPNVPLHGVEDMLAKTRYGFVQPLVSDDASASIKRSHQRAQRLFESASKSLAHAISARQRKALDKQLRRYQRTTQKFERAIAKLGEIETASDALAMKNSYLEQAFEFDELLADNKSLIEQFNTASDEQKHELFRNNEATLRRLQSLSESVDDLQKRLKALDDKLKQPSEVANESGEAVYDEFAITANMIRELGESAGMEFPDIVNFYADEAKKARQRELPNAVEELAERDRAMVANTVKYLKENQANIVVLVVGYAHLEGMAQKLDSAGIGFIGGKVNGSTDDQEPWEIDAWQHRKRQRGQIFGKSGLKEESFFTNESWRAEQVGKASVFNDIETGKLTPDVDGLAGGGRIFTEFNDNANHALWVGGQVIDRNASYGRHVAERGPSPSSTEESYMVFDREVATSQVKELSDSDHEFVYSFKRDGQYRFITAEGEHTPRQFFDGLARDKGKQRVLFGEPDEIREGAWTESPLWRQITASADGGGRGRPPTGGKSAAAAADDPGGSRAGRPWGRTDMASGAIVPRKPGKRSDGPQPRGSVVRTNNAERAKQNLIKISRQQPERLGKVQIVDGLSDGQLMLTPGRGDHGHTIMIVARNNAELRAAIKQAAERKQFKNKQVALLTCGDAFKNTAEMRETLLRGGALMVWTPNRQVTPETARRLAKEAATTGNSMSPEQRPQRIDTLLDQVLESWSPSDRGRAEFESAAGWVQVLIKTIAAQLA